MDFNHGTSARMSHAFSTGDRQSDVNPRYAERQKASKAAGMPPEIKMRFSTSPSRSSGAKDFGLRQLTMLSLMPVVRSIQHWWLQRAERHYLICADVEQQRAREAQMNVAYYQKRAALARSARI